MSHQDFRRPEGSEITSPLAEYLYALVIQARGHAGAVMNATEHTERIAATARLLRSLEHLGMLIEPDLFLSSTLSEFED